MYQQKANDSRDQSLRLDEARMAKELKSAADETNILEAKLKEAELRWEEADAMVRQLEGKLRASGASRGDSEVKAVTLEGELNDLKVSIANQPTTPASLVDPSAYDRRKNFVWLSSVGARARNGFRSHSTTEFLQRRQRRSYSTSRRRRGYFHSGRRRTLPCVSSGSGT